MGPGALETALALYQAPSLAAAARLRPVPGDVFEVIRIAAGDSEAITAAVERSGVESSEVREASQLYLKHVLFDPDADHYRVLGVSPDADGAQIREHRRWLLKWLHPDRADEWDAVYAGRVQQAWHHLRDPERRALYDAEMADADDWSAATPGQAFRPVWTARTLPAEERSSRSQRPGTWTTVAVVSLVAVGLAWGLWPSEGPAGSDAGHQAALPPPSAGPYVLERVPLPERPDRPAEEEGGLVIRAESPTGVHVESVSPPQLRETAAGTASTDQPAPVAARALSPTGVANPAPAEPAGPVAPGAADSLGAAAASPERRGSAHDGINEDAVEAALSSFRNAYERGDIDALMAVFTSDARNRRGGREAIRDDYVRLFRSSRQRRLQWHSMRWQAGKDEALGEGGFVATITPRRGATNTVRGRVRIEVVKQGGQVLIRELWHEDQAL